MTGGDGLYLGVDVGTSATRVSLVRPDGTAVVASAGYRTVRGGDGRVEQDPAAWSRALATALRRLRLGEGRPGGRLGESGVDLRAVTAVGLCGQTVRGTSSSSEAGSARRTLSCPSSNRS